MSSNLEPLVNSLVTDNTAKKFINNVDLNLIDPYKISDMDDDQKSPKEKIESGIKQKNKKDEMKRIESNFII